MTSPTGSRPESYAEDLYAGFLGGHNVEHVLPIRRLTREDIEKALDATGSTRMKKRKVDPFSNRTIGLDSRGKPVYNITLNTRQPGSLFSDNEDNNDAARETPSYMTHNGRLQLLRYPPISLYDFDQPVITKPTPLSIFLDVDKYTATRKQVMDDFGGMWTAESMQVDQSVVQQPSSSPDQHTMDLEQPPSTDQQVPTTDTEDQYQYYPANWVPVYATPFQQSTCDEFYNPEPTNDMLSAKVDFTEIIARLNHPLEAMVDDYDVTAADKWNGSGKTQFIRNLIHALNEAQMYMKLAIVTYDMNYESFFFNIIKRELGLPCERISSVLDETWEREYGVLFPTSTAQSYGSNQPTADLVIALDIRLRPNNPVFEKIESHSGNDNDRPPRLWLVTMGSAEMRAAQYMENDTDRPEWDNEWWCDAPGYFDLVWKQNTWPTEEEAMTQRQHVVQSVMQWVKGGCHGEFRYAQKTPTSQHDTTTITTIPSPSTPPEIHIAESSTPPLPPSTPTEPPPTTATDNTITQIKQLFRYPSIFSSKMSSPLPQFVGVEDDDSASSFYSASEFVDTDISGIKNQLGPLRSEYQNECQLIMTKYKQAYQTEMDQLQKKYEQKALEELQRRQQQP